MYKHIYTGTTHKQAYVKLAITIKLDGREKTRAHFTCTQAGWVPVRRGGGARARRTCVVFGFWVIILAFGLVEWLGNFRPGNWLFPFRTREKRRNRGIIIELLWAFDQLDMGHWIIIGLIGRGCVFYPCWRELLKIHFVRGMENS